jgi:hypothetical protein
MRKFMLTAVSAILAIAFVSISSSGQHRDGHILSARTKEGRNRERVAGLIEALRAGVLPKIKLF